MKEFALITGASSGLGREYAIQFAKRGYHLILVSLPSVTQTAFAERLMRKYAVEIKVIETDLTESENIELIKSESEKFGQIKFLVNNAGMGGTKLLEDCDPEYLDGILMLNIRATVMLIKQLLAQLKEGRSGHIINISSMAAFSPIAYKSIYPASKSFIAHFSLALREELSPFGIKVNIVYPGPILTNYQVARRIMHQGSKAKMGLILASDIAKESIENTLSGKVSTLPGKFNKINSTIMKIMPGTWLIKLLSNAVKKELSVQL